MSKKILNFICFLLFIIDVNDFAMADLIEDDVGGQELIEETVHKLGELELSVPNDWKIRESNENTLMLLSGEKENGYYKNITVRSFPGTRYIDEITANYIKGYLRDNYTKYYKLIKDYNSNETEYFTLKNGNQAILIYSTYYEENDEARHSYMHMHVVVSGEKNHYIATFSDLHDNLTNEESASFQTAWTILSGIKIPFVPALSRYETTVNVVYIILIFIGIVISFFILRNFFSRRKLDRFDGDRFDELDDDAEGDSWTLEEDQEDYEGNSFEFDDDLDKPA